MPVFPASDFDPNQFPSVPDLTMGDSEGPQQNGQFPPEGMMSSLPVAAPSDPKMAELFALMEAGGDEDILTDEERQQINAMIPVSNGGEFDRNLAAEMDESDLDFLAQQVCDRFDWDEASRKDWYDREAEGIRLLGVSTNVEGGAAIFPPLVGGGHPAAGRAIARR